ncbi:MAG: NAD(P)H-binding protein [Bacteroidota bacterium]
MLENILVIGATGMLGLPVTKALVEHGLQVSALVRNPEKAAKVLPKEVAFIQGDLKNIDSIERALVGHEAVYLNLSVMQSSVKQSFHTEREGLDNLIKIAEFSGIQRIFYLSSLLQNHKTNWWVLQLKRAALAKLKKSGIPITIFYPSSFMETLDQKLLFSNKIILFGESKYPMYWIAAEDYARQVATAIKANSYSNMHTDYIIQGQKAYTLQEAAKIFIENYTLRPLRIIQLPLNIFQLLAFLHPHIAYGVGISDALNNYPEKFSAEDTWQELGKPEISLQEYARNLS